MKRFFNSSGPCVEGKHYMIPFEARMGGLAFQLRQLFLDERYFVFHAPRQTGKTTLMMALARQMTLEGSCICLYVNVEAAQALRDDVEKVNRAIVSGIVRNAKRVLDARYHPKPDSYDLTFWEDGLLGFLTNWCESLDKPLVLLMDEVDSLVGDGLLSVLRQLRVGYNDRPEAFPAGVCLIGVRDIRDYRIFSKVEKDFVLGGSAFNIKEKAIRLDYFSRNEVAQLFRQHKEDSGQNISHSALSLIFDLTLGQPWLVNAMGRELCFEEPAIAGGLEIQCDHVRQAKERLIERRDVHLDQLSDKLTEPRVARVIEQVLLGQESAEGISEEDQFYVIDLGLCRMGDYGLEIANPIYREIVPRVLASTQERMLGQNPKDYVMPDGRLNMERLLERLVAFYRANHDMITKRKTYTEAAHHLVFLAWLHRIVNSGGTIEREYALGLGRMDLCIRYAGEVFGIELKLASKDALEKGLTQLSAYLSRLGISEGVLVIFNRKATVDPETLGRRELHQKGSHSIQVLYL